MIIMTDADAPPRKLSIGEQLVVSAFATSLLSDDVVAQRLAAEMRVNDLYESLGVTRPRLRNTVNIRLPKRYCVNG